MKIAVLVCRADDSQKVEQREVPDSYLTPEETAEDDTPQPLTDDEIPIE